MGFVSSPSRDVVSTLSYYGRAGWLLPTYMFTAPTKNRGFLYTTISSDYAQETQDLLRLNMLYNWLLGDYGPLDDFTITKSNIEDLYEEIGGFPLFFGLTQHRLVIGKELKFWDHILNGDERKSPIKIEVPLNIAAERRAIMLNKVLEKDSKVVMDDIYSSYAAFEKHHGKKEAKSAFNLGK